MGKLTEEETKLRLITPAINERGAGWSTSKIQMERVFTDGRIIVDGSKTSRGEEKKYDYLLNHSNNFPLAIIEAKDNGHSISAGMQQAIEYATFLDVPFAYSTNGEGFLEHDMLTGLERELAMNEFPTSDELWKRYQSAKSITSEVQKVIDQPYYYELEAKQPRFYQQLVGDEGEEYFGKPVYRYSLVDGINDGFLAPYKVLRVPTNVDAEGYNKNYFTIMDFRGVTRGTDSKGRKFRKQYINGVAVKIYSEQVQYFDEFGKLITKHLITYTRENVHSKYANFQEFLSQWNQSVHKREMIESLKNSGVFLDELRKKAKNDGFNIDDDFDLICYFAFDQKPLTKSERVKRVKESEFMAKYQGVAKEVLENLLDKYLEDGVEDLESGTIFMLDPFRRIGIQNIVQAFGSSENLYDTIGQLKTELFKAVA
ncbi:MAG: hypothetical protein LBQ41_01460 [Candidatus Ancillula sp.]|nr:hypothetical protein [Candidatus Ancillula sp.]